VAGVQGVYGCVCDELIIQGDRCFNLALKFLCLLKQCLCLLQPLLPWLHILHAPALRALAKLFQATAKRRKSCLVFRTGRFILSLCRSQGKTGSIRGLVRPPQELHRTAPGWHCIKLGFQGL
jgi:hypothetical protein